MSTKGILAVLGLTCGLTIGMPAIAAGNYAVIASPPSASHYDAARLSQPQYRVTLQANARIPMRDGITLAADIFRPDAPGRFPVILTRTPYNRAGAAASEQARWFAARGYVVVNVDARGRWDSEGSFYAFRDEADDGYDTDEWIGRQSWFEGGICTIGGSYVGYTQWAQLVRASKYLKCAAPSVTTGNVHGGWIYTNGALHYGFALPWGGIDMQGHVAQYAEDFDWPSIYRHLPVVTSDEAGHHITSWYRDWMAHPTRDSYWDGISVENGYHNITVPILTVEGWYDIFLQGALEDDIAVRKVAKTPEARAGKRLMIGPWAHSVGGRVALTNGRNGGAPPDPQDFGDNAAVNLRLVYLRWFDHWLKGIDNGVATEAPVKLFVMGLNYWRDEQEWPLARTQYTKYYISSGGRANGSIGDGVLSAQPPRSGAVTDTYSYDPANPVPSMGGNVCCSNVPSGPWDQRTVELRPDVLVYTTPVMQAPMEITGPIRMMLYAATSAEDTDWTAKLVDVYPNGYAQNIQSGIVRARYRNGMDKPADFIKPGQVYEYTIDMWATSHVVLPGHRLRLEVSSSDFPRFDRNLNTRESPEMGTQMQIALQTVHHSARYPSHVLLPLIPLQKDLLPVTP
jgi:putative CocE/NonD family hydrolase